MAIMMKYLDLSGIPCVWINQKQTESITFSLQSFPPPPLAHPISSVRPASRLSGPGPYRLATICLATLCAILLISIIAVSAHCEYTTVRYYSDHFSNSVWFFTLFVSPVCPACIKIPCMYVLFSAVDFFLHAPSS